MVHIGRWCLSVHETQMRLHVTLCLLFYGLLSGSIAAYGSPESSKVHSQKHENTSNGPSTLMPGSHPPSSSYASFKFPSWRKRRPAPTPQGTSKETPPPRAPRTTSRGQTKSQKTKGQDEKEMSHYTKRKLKLAKSAPTVKKPFKKPVLHVPLSRGKKLFGSILFILSLYLELDAVFLSSTTQHKLQGLILMISLSAFSLSIRGYETVKSVVDFSFLKARPRDDKNL